MCEAGMGLKTDPTEQENTHFIFCARRLSALMTMALSFGWND
jgi:hypothetical protein